MITANMLTQSCKVYRLVDDSSHSFVQQSEQLVGTYPCYLSQKRQPVQYQTNPQHLIICTMELLLNLPADIKKGDRVDVEGESYAVGYIRKPLNRHMQVDLYLEDEA